jgi:gliding motility-associated lipoprotein GldD
MLRYTGIAILILFAAACRHTFQPKPRAYFRIELPQHEYKMFDSAGCPFSCKIPVYSVMVPDTMPGSGKWWMNLAFPSLNAVLHLSYKEITADSVLVNAINDCHKLTYKHTIKAEDIIESEITNNHGASGMIYELTGETATGMNFYVTDTVRHFLRGALYFNAKTIPDSIAPALEFAKDDVRMLIGTLRWRED